MALGARLAHSPADLGDLWAAVHPTSGGSALLLLAAALGAGWYGRLRRRTVAAQDALACHARRLEALADVSRLALSASSSGPVFELTVTRAREALDVDLVGVWEVQGDEAILRAGAGWPAGADGRPVLPADERSLLGGLVRTGEPVLIADVEHDADADGKRRALLRALGVSSAAMVAIRDGEKPFGVLAACTTQPRELTPHEMEFMKALAEVVTSATVNRSQADDLETSAALAHVGQELISSLDAPVLVGRLCQLAAESLGTDHSTTWLLQPDEQIYVPIARHGLSAERWETLRALSLPAAAIRAFLGRLGREGVVQVRAKTPEYPLLGEVLDQLGFGTTLFAALRRGEEIIGMQISSARSVAAFTARQERTARGIAHLASMALTNARLVEELERANQLKSEFVSTMSHELRTPLNVIVGYTDMLCDAPAAEDQAAILTKVRRSSLELLEMIEGTLDLNRMAAGRDAACVERVLVGELWDELRTDFGAMPRRSEAALRWQPVPDGAIYTDRRKLKIVLKNLVGNALKFTERGEVRVGCERNGVAFVFTVQDTGVGIPREQLPHVFEMFRQVDSSDARSYGGAGLGLYIVRRLLTQLGGEINVESEPGKGSTFRVVLPAPEEGTEALALLTARHRPDGNAAAPIVTSPVPSRPAPSADAGTPQRRRRILFADDLPLNRLLLRRFLNREFPDVDVIEAVDGVQAVAMTEVHRPDLLVLDMRMPEMEGWQAARNIRRLPCGRDVPIIGMSVNAAPGMEAVALAAGCNEFLPKPVSDYRPLRSRVQHWLSVTPPRPPESSDDHPAGVCALCRRTLQSNEILSTGRQTLPF
jgi:signal transduction histidine kinase/CheY-like chemotaxis protein